MEYQSMGTLNTPLRSTEHSSGAGVIYDDDSDDSKYAFDEHLSTPVMKLSQMSDMDRRSHSTSKTGQPFFERAFSTIEVGSVRGSIFTLTSTAIGAGLLSLPMVLKMVGVGLGLVMLVLGACLAYFSIQCLVQCSSYTGIKNYSELTREIFGHRWGLGLELMLVLYCFGTCVAYLIVIGNNIQSILKATNIHIDQTELVIFLTGAVIFPMACLKNLSSLRYAAIISVCSMLYVSLAMSINSISHSDLHDMPLVHVEPDVFQAITITFFAYTCHTNVFSIYSELSEPLVRRMSKVSLRAIVLEFCLYAYCAFFGYISFRDNTQGNILDNYSDTDPLFIAARGCVTIALLVALPLNFCPCRDNLDTMAFGKRPFSMSRHLAWTIGLCTAVLVVALCVPGVKIVFGILGASSSVFFCYLLPMKLYTHIFNAQLSRCTYYSIKLMQHTVVVIGAVSIYMSISDAVNGTAQ